MARNDIPTNIPNKTKLIVVGDFFIFKICNNDNDQKKIKKTSVDTKKEENETEGIKKNDNDVTKASSTSFTKFLDIKKTIKEVRQYIKRGIIFKTKKLLPNTEVTKPITHGNKGGLEKYPNSKLFDQTQYCASSPNKLKLE